MAQGNITANTAISIRDLTVHLGGRDILSELDLDILKGEVLGIVGGSGSGKSVLMRTIIGLLPKSGGSIKILDADVDKLDAAEFRKIERQWGVMFQHGALFSSLNVKQNIQFQMREALHLSQRLLDEMAIAKLEMVGLRSEDGNKFPSQLSGGMTKRAALARALALDPKFLFLDEPTSGLDPISAGEFDDLIKTLHKTFGLTVFLVTHDLEILHTVTDRIAVIAEGKIVSQGNIKELLKSDHPWVKAYFHGKRGESMAQRHFTD